MILGTGRIAVKKKISQNLYYQSFYSSQGSDIIKGKKVKVKLLSRALANLEPSAEMHHSFRLYYFRLFYHLEIYKLIR